MGLGVLAGWIKALFGLVVAALTFIANAISGNIVPLPLMIPLMVLVMGGTAWALNQVFWRREIDPRLRRLEPEVERLLDSTQAPPMIEIPTLPEIDTQYDVGNGRLLSSLSALRSEGIYFRAEIEKAAGTSDYVWGLFHGIILEWFRSVKRVLEAWDENNKSELFGFSGAAVFNLSINNETEGERRQRVIELIDRIMGRIDNVINDLK